MGGDTLVYTRAGETDRLDPIHVDTGESVKVIVNIFDTLIAYDERTTELVPGLATRWEASEDGLTWTFHLRPDVKFHDGTPLDAEAVVFSFSRLIDPEHPHVYDDVIPYATNFQNISSVTAVDPLTVQFELKEPSAVFEANLAMFPACIVSPAAVEKYGKDFGTHPVGTGPFQFDSWIRDQQLVLKANPDHWRGAPGMKRVVFIATSEPAVRAQQLLRGEAHIVEDLPPTEVNALEGRPNIKVQEVPGLNVGYLTIQTEKPPLDNAKVRQAIWHAIDKQRLIDLVYAGKGNIATTMVPPTMWGFDDELEDRQYDPELARTLLREAAEESGFTLPLELDLFLMASARPYMPQPQETAAFIKDQLAQVGINLRLITSETSLHFKRLSAGEHDLGLAGWSSDNADPDNFLYQLLDKDNINDLGGNNTSRYRNQTVHDLLKLARVELDREKREQLYRQVQRIVYMDTPVVPLVNTNVRVALRDELQGYQLHPTSLPWLRNAHFPDQPQ